MGKLALNENKLTKGDGLLIGGEDERRAVVKVYTNRSVREGIAHAVLIAIVNPGRDKNPLLWQIYVIAWVAKQLPPPEGIKRYRERFGRGVESVYLRRLGSWSCSAAGRP
jgi:hypothetical protein